MAHLWAVDNEQQWHPIALVGPAAIRSDGSLAADGVNLNPGAVLRRVDVASGAWALLSHDPDIRVNGAPVSLGLVVLADRDEIRIGDRVLWFSTETLPLVEPFPHTTAGGHCPRCKQPIETAAPALKCPGCGLWHHASADLPCWTYAATCAACDRETALDAGYRWTPEDL